MSSHPDAAAAVDSDIQGKLEADLHRLTTDLSAARELLPGRLLSTQTASSAVLEAHLRVREVDNDPRVQAASRELALAEAMLHRAQQRLNSATAARNLAEREAIERIDLLGKEGASERAREAVADTDARIGELEKEVASVLNLLHGVGEDKDWGLQAALVESVYAMFGT